MLLSEQRAYVKTDYTRETSPGRQRKRAGAAQGEITRKRQVRRRARAARRIIGWRARRRRWRYFSVALRVALRRQRQMPHREPLVHFDLDCRIPGRHRRSGRVLHDPRLVGADVAALRLAALRASVVRPVPPSLGGLFLRVVRRLAAGDFGAHCLRARARAAVKQSELGLEPKEGCSFPGGHRCGKFVNDGVKQLTMLDLSTKKYLNTARATARRDLRRLPGGKLLNSQLLRAFVPKPGTMLHMQRRPSPRFGGGRRGFYTQFSQKSASNS